MIIMISQNFSVRSSNLGFGKFSKVKQKEKLHTQSSTFSFLLPKDKKLFLWQSAVTDSNLAEFALALPDVEIDNGIKIEGTQGIFPAPSTPVENVIVQACCLGTDPAVTTALPNGDDGLDITLARSCLIGGPEFWMGNLISGNNRQLFSW